MRLTWQLNFTNKQVTILQHFDALIGQSCLTLWGHLAHRCQHLKYQHHIFQQGIKPIVLLLYFYRRRLCLKEQESYVWYFSIFILSERWQDQFSIRRKSRLLDLDNPHKTWTFLLLLKKHQDSFNSRLLEFNSTLLIVYNNFFLMIFL